MSIRTMGLMVAACVSTGAAFAAADPTNVRRINADATVYTKGAGNIVGEINFNGTMATNAAHYAGTMPVVDMQAGSTLVYTNSSTVRVGLVVTNGTATIVFPDDAVPTFTRGVVVRDTGCLVLSNVTVAVFGHGGDSAATDFSDAPRHYYDTRNVRFMRNGELTTGTIKYKHARIVNFPEDTGITIDYVQSAQPLNYLCGTDDDFKDQVAQHFNKLGPTCVMSAETAPAGYTLTVPSGMTLTFEPTTNFDYSVARMVQVFSSDRCLPDLATDFVFAGNLVQTDATSVISNNEDLAAITFTGSLSGAGRVTLPIGGTDEGNRMRRTFGGDMSGFTGAFDVYSPHGSFTRKVFGELVVSNSLAAATVNVGPNVAFAPAGTDAPFAVKALNGTALRASTLAVAANQRVQIGTAGGTPAFTGAGAAVSEVNILAWDANFAYTADDQVAVTFGSARSTSVPAGAANVTASTGEATFTFLPSETGVTDLAAVDAAAKALGLYHFAIDVADGVRVKNTAAGLVARVAEAESVSVTAQTETQDVGISVAGEGTVTLTDTLDKTAWMDSVAYWFDFSRGDTLRRASSDEWPTDRLLNGTGEHLGGTYPIFERCLDWRGNRTGSMWQGVYYYQTGGYSGATASLYPMWVTNKYTQAEGLSYMAFPNSGSGRMPFAYSRDKANGGEELPVKYVVMVYGAMNGGGYSLVADSDSIFMRDNGSSKGYLKTQSDKVTIRTNGVALATAEQTTATPTDWQVVTLAMSGDNRAKFRGLGYYGTSKQKGNGYSAYGEVLLITNEITAVQLAQAERYLAQKWGLPYDTTWLEAQEQQLLLASTNTVVAIGSPKVVAGARAVRLGGNFAGEVQLTGGKLVVDGALPYTEAQVAAVSNRVFWVDGDDRANVKLVNDTDTQLSVVDSSYSSRQVRAVKNKTDADFRTGPIMVGLSCRMPYWLEVARGLGPTRHWLDFYEWRFPGVSPTIDEGNNLRIVKKYTGTSWELGGGSVTKETLTVQTILFAHDSSYGGGAPVYDSATGNSGYFDARATSDPSSAVWWDGKKKCTAFREGLNRIDGVTQTNPNGFGGKPEVYTVRGTSSITTQYFIDSLQNSQNYNNKHYAACVGEMLYFSSALEMADIQGIEAYLMQKWLGTLPTGFADVRQATVSGNGTVEVTDAAKMPRIASAFTGTVSVGGETGTLAMTVDVSGQTVQGALVNAGATFELPAAVRIKLDVANVTKSASVRRFTLVEANTGATTFKLDEASTGVPKSATIENSTTSAGLTKVELVLPPSGLIMFYR